jgi:hypothetical protein
MSRPKLKQAYIAVDCDAGSDSFTIIYHSAKGQPITHYGPCTMGDIADKARVQGLPVITHDGKLWAFLHSRSIELLNPDPNGRIRRTLKPRKTPYREVLAALELVSSTFGEYSERLNLKQLGDLLDRLEGLHVAFEEAIIRADDRQALRRRAL